MLLQPGEHLHALALRTLVEDLAVTAACNAVGAPQLDGDDDQADEPEHEKHEAADHDDGGEEAPLEDQPEHQPDEDDDNGRNGYVVGEIPAGGKICGQRGGGGGRGGGRRGINPPWYAQLQLHLNHDKVRKDAEDSARCDQHDQHPQVELDRGPMVLVDPLDAPFVDDVAVCDRRDHVGRRVVCEYLNGAVRPSLMSFLVSCACLFRWFLLYVPRVRRVVAAAAAGRYFTT